jgi:hypothetical protein
VAEGYEVYPGSTRADLKKNSLPPGSPEQKNDFLTKCAETKEKIRIWVFPGVHLDGTRHKDGLDAKPDKKKIR